MAPWLYIAVATLFCTTSTTAFVQPGLGLSVQITQLYSRTSPNAPGLKDADIDETQSFDPFNYAENKGADLIPTGIHDNSSSLDNPNNQGGDDIGLWAARGILLFVAVLWGTNFASVKYLETLCFHPPCVHPPSEAALARFGLAALVSIPLLLNQRKDVILAGLECGLWVTMGYIAQALALSTISSGKCAFICSLTVVVVPLVDSIFFGKPIKKISLVSAALALAGVGVLEGLVDTNSLLGIQPALADSSEMVASTASTAAATGFLGFFQKMGIGKGDLLAILQPIGFGVSFIRIEHYVEKFKDVKNRVVTIAASECVMVGLLSLFWVLYDFHGTIPNMEYMMDPHRLAAIGWTGIVTTVGAIYLEGLALETASATDAALTFASEPVWASLFGAWLLHEKLNLNAYLGGGVILAACLMSALADLPTSDDGGDDGEIVETDMS